MFVQLDSIAEEATLSADVRDSSKRDADALKIRLAECEQRLSSATEDVTISRRHCAIAEGLYALILMLVKLRS